jgi:hypothetical protein
MKIFGLTIHGFHRGSSRRRRVTSKLERIAYATLLTSALENAETLFTIINKFGQIEVQNEDEIKTKLKNMRAEIYRKAVETILNKRRQELANRIDEIIDRVIGLNTQHEGQQYEAGSFEGVIPGKQNDAPAASRWRRTRVRSSQHTSSLSALLRDLKMLATLGQIDNQKIKKRGGSDIER